MTGIKLENWYINMWGPGENQRGHRSINTQRLKKRYKCIQQINTESMSYIKYMKETYKNEQKIKISMKNY